MPDFLIKSPQHLNTPVHLGHLATQALKDGGEFAGDVAAAHNQQARRERVQIEQLVGGDDELAPMKIGYVRGAAGGDQESFGGQGLVVG